MDNHSNWYQRTADSAGRDDNIGAGGEAGAKALQHAGVDPEAVDLVIVATVTPEMLFPSTACLVQDKLGCTNAGASICQPDARVLFTVWILQLR